MIKPLLQKFRISTGTVGFRDGRACFLSLKEYYHGKQQKNVKLFAVTAELQKIHWTNTVSFTAENYTMRLLDCFNTIDEFGTPWEDDAKSRQLHQSLYRASDSLPPVLWIESFKNELLDNIDEWTFQRAIEKFNYIAKMHLPKKTRNASSAGVNNTGSRPNKKDKKRGKGGCNRGKKNNSVGGRSEHSGWPLYYNTETGKPSGRYIYGVDLEPLFNKGKIPEKDFNRLPRVVKQWFADIPDAKVPWDVTKTRSKANQNSKRARKKAYVDAIVSNGVTLVTEDPQSQMSTASQN